MYKKTLFDFKNIMLSLLLIILIIVNIYTIIKSIKEKQEAPYNEIVINTCENEFDSDQKYYTEITFKRFQSLLKSKETFTVAIIDNSSKTYNKFIETINKIAYYKNTNLYLLEISKLSKKNEITFYELDERLKKLESDYMITIHDEKIISITSFNEYYLNVINESLK